jgi:hypothetical protein
MPPAVDSALFYGYALMQIPGGWLANRYGGKPIMLGVVMLTCISTAIFPLIARNPAKSVMCVILPQIGRCCLAVCSRHHFFLQTLPKPSRCMAAAWPGMLHLCVPIYQRQHASTHRTHKHSTHRSTTDKPPPPPHIRCTLDAQTHTRFYARPPSCHRIAGTHRSYDVRPGSHKDHSTHVGPSLPRLG